MFWLGLVCGIGLSIIAALCIGFRDARRDLREQDAMLEADRLFREGPDQ
ncbi:hypothetical protein [Methylobacterium sp. P1-11]|nr:hypothetical protein [Methylobacterium sp. P1-11]